MYKSRPLVAVNTKVMADLSLTEAGDQPDPNSMLVMIVSQFYILYLNQHPRKENWNILSKMLLHPTLLAQRNTKFIIYNIFPFI